MQKISDLTQVNILFGEHRKWERTLEAIRAAERLEFDVAYSVGDSLTFVKRRAQAVSSAGQTVSSAGHPQVEGHLTGHRCYLQVYAVLRGQAELVYAPKSAAKLIRAYSDLDDEEHYALLATSSRPAPDGSIEASADHPVGWLKQIPLIAGEIALLSTDECDQLILGKNAEIVSIKVTVEGHSFHNK